MKKVIIIGCPGSGKSTFGRKLKEITGLPLYHLDMMYWNEDRSKVEKEVFIDRLKAVMGNPEWIIDGNYGATIKMRLCKCDTVFFLDYPKEVCIEGIKSRKGKPRSDMPWIETDDTDKEFISFTENYNTESRPEVIRLIEKYPKREVYKFCNREEAEEFLKNLKKEKI